MARRPPRIRLYRRATGGHHRRRRDCRGWPGRPQRCPPAGHAARRFGFAERGHDRRCPNRSECHDFVAGASDVFGVVAYYSGCADAADNGVADGVVYRFDDDVFDGRVFTRGPPGTYSLGVYRCCPPTAPGYPSICDVSIPNAVVLSSNRVQDLTVPIGVAHVTVIGPTGQPVSGALLQPDSYLDNSISLWPGGPPGSAYTGGQPEGTTAADGTVAVGLVAHNGVLLRATPPAGSGLPSAATTVDARTDLSVTISLPAPVTFSGLLRTTQGVPMPLTTVSLRGRLPLRRRRLRRARFHSRLRPARIRSACTGAARQRRRAT